MILLDENKFGNILNSFLYLWETSKDETWKSVFNEVVPSTADTTEEGFKHRLYISLEGTFIRQKVNLSIFEIVFVCI